MQLLQLRVDKKHFSFTDKKLGDYIEAQDVVLKVWSVTKILMKRYVN